MYSIKFCSAVFLFVISFVCSPVLAFQAPSSGVVLPNYDCRHHDSMLQFLDHRTINVSPTRIQLDTLDKLSRGVSAPLAIRWNPRTGLPHFLFSYHGNLTAPSNDAPETIARRFLYNYRELFRFTPDDLSSFQIIRSYTDSFNDVTHILFQQSYQGIPVYHGEVRLNIAASGAIISVGAGDSIPELSFDPAWKMNAPDAVINAISFLNRNCSNLKPVSSSMDSHNTFTADGFRDVIRVEPVIFPLGIIPAAAWKIYAVPEGYPSSYEILIDADTGILLLRANLTMYAETQGKVFVINPGKRPPQLVAFPDDSFYVVPESPIGWAYVDQTMGNNVDAKDDRSGDDEMTIGARAAGTGTPIYFNFTFTNNPAADLEIGITNAFYGVNWIHDYMYRLGFTEATGNFQEDNFGKGGKSGDYIYADVQDGSLPNNASFSVVYDGFKGRMTLGIWSFGGPPSRDSALDMDVLYHEFQHGVSSRLVGGPDNNTALLLGAQDGALAESMSDLIPASIFNDNIVGEFSANDYDNGVRNSPLGENTLSYEDICPLSIYCEPHDDGEIYSAAAWDFRELIVDIYGNESGKYMFERLVIDALKFSVSRPSFLDMRDAMLMADLHDFGGINSCMIWQAFAGRGMGYSASTTDADDPFPVEGADLPPWCNDEGAVTFNRSVYSCDDNLVITVFDGNAFGVTMSVTTPGGDTETFTGKGNNPVWRTGPVRVIEVSSIPDIIPGDGILQVLEGEIITAAYHDISPAGKRTATAVIDCMADVRYMRHQFVNGSCDTDTVTGFPELPGFLDAGESADLDIYIANFEQSDIQDAVVTLACDNPNVSFRPMSPVPVGTLIRQVGSSTSSYRLTYQCSADPGVVTGETATFTVSLAGKGYKGTESTIEFTISMNHDYSTVPDLTWSEDFEGPGASLWTHAVAGTNPNDEWNLVNCLSHSGTRSYHNGQPACADYTDDQGSPYLASPPITLGTSDTRTIRLKSLRFFHNVDLGVDPVSGVFDADIVGVYMRNAPIVFNNPLIFMNMSDNVEGVVDFYGNITSTMVPFTINDNTGGAWVEKNIDLEEGGFPFMEGGFLNLDYSQPIHLIWIFLVDFAMDYGDHTGNGYYLDDITLTYDRIDRVPQGHTCIVAPTRTPVPTFTPYVPTPTPGIPYPVPAISFTAILLLLLIAVIPLLVALRNNLLLRG